MAFNGSGTYSPPAAPNFPAVTGTTISSSYYNTVINDIAGGLSNTICRDGQSIITANIPMNNHKFTGLTAGNATGNSVEYDQMNTAIAAAIATVLTNGTQVFTTNGTFIVPNCHYVKVTVIGSGGGGGGGCRFAAATTRSGGGGGGGGGVRSQIFSLVELGGAAASIPITIGGGGAAGLGATVDNTSGTPGGQGGVTSFGNFIAMAGGRGGNLATSIATVSGGNGGPFGAASGTNYSAVDTGGTGGSGNANVAGSGGVSGYYSGAGGGGGGGISSANVTQSGGIGGDVIDFNNAILQAGGLAAAAGAQLATSPYTGSGGGGGTGNSTVPTAGGAGGAGGGGGGGGGSSANGANAANGGVGGRGEIRIWWW